jgi:peptide/nickel transport system ATP-binding protein
VVDDCHHITPTLRRLGDEHDAACHVAQPDPGTRPTTP